MYRTTVGNFTKVTEELLDLMVAAIEARDPYTSGHSQRVSRASKIIAQTLGLKPAEVERVGIAALFHDVGKIDEAFAPILAKEGRLTPEEWDIMKRHPIRSAELVGLLTSLRDVVPAVRHHHENWDGTGYPDGIRAESIPLASRISLALAASQMRAVLSPDAVTMRDPSGLKAAEYTDSCMAAQDRDLLVARGVPDAGGVVL